MIPKAFYKNGFTISGVIVLVVVASFFYANKIPFIYNAYTSSLADSLGTSTIMLNRTVPSHIETPKQVKAIYITSWVAGNEKLRSKLFDFVDNSEINSVVIDIKDYTGRISFEVKDKNLKDVGSYELRINDIDDLIERLHKKGIYVIGRISVFQDLYYVKKFPEYAVKTKEGEVWRDYKGISWLDAGAKPVWDYIVDIGNEAYKTGFDELNFDYIRFPSDGNMDNIKYEFAGKRNKSEVLKDFFAYLDLNFREKNIPISADLFGMTTSNNDDLGIGQILGNALIHFDYVAPMVYPSHYPPNFNGWPNPAKEPYAVIKFVLEKGKQKAIMASTSPEKIRPWLQDFGINGVPYTPAMVRAQIQATNDVGLQSWMIWNAGNNYSQSAFEPDLNTKI